MELAERLERIGKRIKLIRIAKGFHQYDVAQAMGISQAHLSNIERGRNSTTLELLFKLSDLLECPLSDFFVDVDKKKKQNELDLSDEQLRMMLLMVKNITK